MQLPPPLRLRQRGEMHSVPVANEWLMRPSWMVHGAIHCQVISPQVTPYLSAGTRTGLPMSVSPEPFCTPEVFGLVANILHISETLLVSMTTHLLASATGSRRKTEVNLPWIHREKTLPWHFNKIACISHHKMEFLRLQWEINGKWVSRCSRQLQKA